MAITLAKDKVLKNWAAIIENGAGKGEYILDTTEKLIKEANMPNVTVKREIASSGMFGEKRELLMATHQKLREYAFFMGARDFGRDLDVHWFLTVNPGSLKRAISKRLANGDPFAFSQMMDLFTQQDLSAFTQICRNAFEKVAYQVAEGLNQNPAALGLKSILSNW